MSLVRCKTCWQYRCENHARGHDCSQEPRLYEVNDERGSRIVSKAEFDKFEKKHGPFNPPPTVMGSGFAGHGTPYRCADCPDPMLRLMGQ